jgi:hypothetical protein
MHQLSSPGNTKGGCITVPLTSCLTGLNSSVLQINAKIVSSLTADSKPVKQEVNSTMILPPLVFPGLSFISQLAKRVRGENSQTRLAQARLV